MTIFLSFLNRVWWKQEFRNISVNIQKDTTKLIWILSYQQHLYPRKLAARNTYFAISTKVDSPFQFWDTNLSKYAIIIVITQHEMTSNMLRTVLLWRLDRNHGCTKPSGYDPLWPTRSHLSVSEVVNWGLCVTQWSAPWQAKMIAGYTRVYTLVIPYCLFFWETSPEITIKQPTHQTMWEWFIIAVFLLIWIIWYLTGTHYLVEIIKNIWQ